MISLVPAVAAAAFAACLAKAGDLAASAGKAGGGRAGTGKGAGAGTGSRKGRGARGNRPVPPPELPEAPAWGYGPDGEFVDRLRNWALETKNASGPFGEAVCWDAIRGVLRAARGPGDPRVWSAACRSARALASSGGVINLAGAAALADGAAEGMIRAAGDPEDASRMPPPAETAFAARLREALLLKLSRLLDREPPPRPAPAFSLWTALFPVPAAPGAYVPVPDPAGPGPGAPGPAELRTALAEAERDDPGSWKSLVIRSRLGEAVAAAEARARAGVTSLYPRRPETDGGRRASGTAPAGAAGDGTAEDLLRSASEGLDALLGGTHPDSLDARERLAFFLAGFPEPGVPPEPFACERPAAADASEALELFLGVAAARACADAGDGELPRKAARRAKRRAEGAAGQSDGAEAPVRPELEAVLERFRRSEDVRALAAAASAAECTAMTDVTGEGALFLAKAGETAEAVLGPRHPVTLRFLPLRAVARLAGDDPEGCFEILMRESLGYRNMLGSSSRRSAAALFRVGLAIRGLMHPPVALSHYCEVLEALEDTGWGAGPSPWADGRGRGLPPGRAGRDCLMARVSLARCLPRTDAAAALDVLRPCLEALRDPPPAGGGPGPRPWPPELEGMALALAGMAASELGDSGRAEPLLRRSLDALGPFPKNPGYLKEALETLSRILAARADADSLREAELLSERAAGLGVGGTSETMKQLSALLRAGRNS
jgi:hypothetical protein